MSTPPTGMYDLTSSLITYGANRLIGMVSTTSATSTTPALPKKPIDELSLIISLALSVLYPMNVPLKPRLSQYSFVTWDSDWKERNLKNQTRNSTGSRETINDWKKIIGRAIQMYRPGMMIEKQANGFQSSSRSSLSQSLSAPNEDQNSDNEKSSPIFENELHAQITMLFEFALKGLRQVKAAYSDATKESQDTSKELDNCMTKISNALEGKIDLKTVHNPKENERREKIMLIWSTQRIMGICQYLQEGKQLQEQEDNLYNFNFCKDYRKTVLNQLRIPSKQTLEAGLRDPIP